MIEMGPKLSFKLGGATVTATGSKASGFRGFLPTPAAQPTHALRARSLGSFHDEDHVDNFFPEDYSQYISDYFQKLSPRSRVHSTNLNDQLFDCVNVYIMMAPKGCGLETPPLLSAVHVD